jgi:Uma2 family endonuclease
MAVAEREILSRPRYDGLPMSEQEIMSLPDDGYKYELVDGRAKLVPANGDHGAIATWLVYLLHAWGVLRYGMLTDSSTGYRLPSGDVRVPDVGFIRWERLPDRKPPRGFVEGAPDLAVEIISPSEDKKDMGRKVGEYFEAGAQQVWQIFPVSRRIVIYSSMDDVQTYTTADIITGADLLPGFEHRVATILGAGLEDA